MESGGYQLNLPNFDLNTQQGYVPVFSYQLFEEEIKTFSTQQGSNQKISFLSLIGEALTAYLPMEARIRTTASVGRSIIEARTPLHSLLDSSLAQQRLSEETGRVFKNTLFLDITDGSKLTLRVTGGKKDQKHGRLTARLRY